MSSPSIKKKAYDEVERLKAAAAAEQVAQAAAAAAAAAERDSLERDARIIVAAERQQAFLRAERLEAEQAAAAQVASEKAAIAAEVKRLLARSPLEILQDEMDELIHLATGDPSGRDG